MNTIEVKSMNRKTRRRLGKLAQTKLTGVQDPPEATMEVYLIPMKRISRAGVEYTYYKKVIDKIGLRKND